MRTFVIGDIHGGLRALQQVLERAPIEFGDRLIFLGDYVDGWSESAGVIAFLMELKWSYSCVFIRGNHDKWCEDWLKTGEIDATWLLHGGQGTIASYEGLSPSEKQRHYDFLNQMENYYIDEHNRLFVHAGFTSMHGVEKEHHDSNYSWDRTLWELALVMQKTNISEDSPFYPKRLKHYEKIVIGHTPTTNYGIETPINTGKVINVDTGAAFRGDLSILDIDTENYWQSDPVHLLYPDEKGRN